MLPSAPRPDPHGRGRCHTEDRAGGGPAVPRIRGAPPRGHVLRGGQAFADAFVDPEGLDIGLAAITDGRLLARFVAFAGVGPGCAVVEVGAGTGLLTFEGGLADAAGDDGEVLGVDPAAPLLRLADAKGRRYGHRRVRSLWAPAEALPLEGGQADVVCGSRFLHYCDARRAVSEMRRVARPGGRVAVLAVLEPRLPRAWRPVLDLLAAPEGEPAPLWHAPGDVGGLFGDCGLEEVETLPLAQRARLPEPEICMRLLTQVSLLEAAARGLPPATRRARLDAAYREVRALLDAGPRHLVLRYELVRGRVPQGRRPRR
jgi:SAM-dependent methyltransferase